MFNGGSSKWKSDQYYTSLTPLYSSVDSVSGRRIQPVSHNNIDSSFSLLKCSTQITSSPALFFHPTNNFVWDTFCLWQNQSDEFRRLQKVPKTQSAIFVARSWNFTTATLFASGSAWSRCLSNDFVLTQQMLLKEHEQACGNLFWRLSTLCTFDWTTNIRINIAFVLPPTLLAFALLYLWILCFRSTTETNDKTRTKSLVDATNAVTFTMMIKSQRWQQHQQQCYICFSLSVNKKQNLYQCNLSLLPLRKTK